MSDLLDVLVVDDDAGTRANLRDILELDDFRVDTAATAAEALARPDWSRYAAVILDRKLPDGSAEELLPHLRRLAPDAAVLIVTGYADLEGAIAALQQGAADYILKPINPDALRASLHRVADRRRLARAKEHSEAAFRSLVEAAPCMIVILRPDLTIAYFSPFAEELTGRTAAEVTGRDFFSTFLPERFEAGAAGGSGGGEAPPSLWLRSALAGEAPRGVETSVLCADGSRRWLIWNAQLLPDYEGGPAALSVGQDITALKHAQERTLQAERLAAIGQMVAGLAHESGNALARSQACLEMLAMEVGDRQEALDLLARVQKAQNHLQRLYEEVRNYAAPLKLEREPWGVDSVWRQAWSNLAVRRQGRNATLHEERGGRGLGGVSPPTHRGPGGETPPTQLSLHCPVDPFRLEQVFRNVLENALAACPDPVVVTISCSESSLGGRPALRVAVRDNGPGLSSEQRQRIFEPFYTTKTKGTGLGMAIAQRIVEAHGGRLAVGGGAGPGAEILITLPREFQ